VVSDNRPRRPAKLAADAEGRLQAGHSRTGEAASDEQELAERAVALMREHDAFSEWLGIEVVSLAPRTCTVRAKVREDMLNGFGVCHGGVTFALADSALAFASNTHGRLTMSVENGISYVAPVHVRDVLTATATEEAAGGPLAYYRVTVRNQSDQPVALFRGTVYRTKRALLDDTGADETT
jgi:acyl-CoA thioesterase